MTKHKEFKNACLAQEFYLEQSSPRFWHWSFQNNHYCLDYYKGEDANDKVISIEEIDSEDYVYDIETEDGTFQCGLGSMILKNTDSIYTKFILPNSNDLNEQERLNQVAKVSEVCAEKITKTFKPPIQLEFEKIMFPLLLFTKKQYAYQGFEPGKQGLENKGVDIKGLQIIKREFCPYVNRLGMSVLNKILVDRDPKSAELLARKMVQDLLENKVPLEELIVSKSLKAKYKDTNKNGDPLTKPAHWYLAERMKKRDPMNAPKGGDRVSYVFVETENKHALQCDRIEDPTYVETHPKECKIDSLYYLKKQISSPLYAIFSCLMTDKNGNSYDLINKKIPKECCQQIDQIWQNAVRQKENQLRKQHQLTKWFKNTTN